MLPLVASIIVEPGFMIPSFSAASIIDSAILSFMLPVGFKNSSFANIEAQQLSVTLLSLISGVLPISSSTLLTTFMPIHPVLTRMIQNQLAPIKQFSALGGCLERCAAELYEVLVKRKVSAQIEIPVERYRALGSDELQLVSSVLVVESETHFLV